MVLPCFSIKIRRSWFCSIKSQLFDLFIDQDPSVSLSNLNISHQPPMLSWFMSQSNQLSTHTSHCYKKNSRFYLPKTVCTSWCCVGRFFLTKVCSSTTTCSFSNVIFQVHEPTFGQKEGGILGRHSEFFSLVVEGLYPRLLVPSI